MKELETESNASSIEQESVEHMKCGPLTTKVFEQVKSQRPVTGTCNYVLRLAFHFKSPCLPVILYATEMTHLLKYIKNTEQSCEITYC